MPGKPSPPSVLSGHAAEIWQSAFEAAYDGTCARREDRDGCAAAIAWSAVKRQYRRDETGRWVEKTISIPRLTPTARGQAEAGRSAERQEERMSEAQIARKDYSDKTRQEYAEKGWALPDGSYPIADRGDLMDAIRSYGRAPVEKRTRVRRHIMKRARELDAEEMIPEEWRSEVKRAVEAYIARREERKRLNDADLAVAQSPLGGMPAVRPPYISGDEWRSMNASQRTVGALLTARVCTRTYQQAVEDAMLDGWWAFPSPGRPQEMLFRREVRGADGRPVIAQAVLVRRSDSTEWHLREVSTGLGGTAALRLGPSEVRYGGPLVIIRRAFPVGMTKPPEGPENG